MKKLIVIGMLLMGLVSAKADITIGHGYGPNGSYHWMENRIDGMTFGHGYGPNGSFHWMENNIGGTTFGHGYDSRGNNYSWNRFDYGWSGSNRSGGLLGIEDDDDE